VWGIQRAGIDPCFPFGLGAKRPRVKGFGSLPNDPYRPDRSSSVAFLRGQPFDELRAGAWFSPEPRQARATGKNPSLALNARSSQSLFHFRNLAMLRLLQRRVHSLRRTYAAQEVIPSWPAEAWPDGRVLPRGQCASLRWKPELPSARTNIFSSVRHEEPCANPMSRMRGKSCRRKQFVSPPGGAFRRSRICRSASTQEPTGWG